MTNDDYIPPLSQREHNATSIAHHLMVPELRLYHAFDKRVPAAMSTGVRLLTELSEPMRRLHASLHLALLYPSLEAMNS